MSVVVKIDFIEVVFATLATQINISKNQALLAKGSIYLSLEIDF